MSMSVESFSKVSSLLCTQCSVIYERLVFRDPHTDKRMEQSDGKEGFVGQLVYEAGAESEAGAEKNPKPNKQPLILLWNRYQAST